MELLKLSDDQARAFDEMPEVGMGVQFARTRNKLGEDELGFILSGRVVMLSDATRTDAKKPTDELTNWLWFGGHVRKVMSRDEELNPYRGAELRDDDIQKELGLIGILADAPEDLAYVGPADPFVMGFILNPIGYLPPTPARPAYIYGHLPFTGVTQAGDRYFRCEHWAISRRVLPPNTIRAGTYGFPESELGFVPTGFSAVGRYALP